MKKIAFRSGAAALAAATMLLTGCTSDDAEPKSGGAAQTRAQADNGVAALTADEILAKAKEAVTKAGSYHISGSNTAEGTTMTMDYRFSGKDLIGKMSMGQGADVDVLAVGGKQYMKPSESFWAMMVGPEQAKTMAAATAGKWVAVPAGDSSSSFLAAADTDELLKPTGTLTKGEAVQVDGKPAITLIDSADAESALFIATTGEPYVLKVGKAATGEGIVFTEFGQKFDIAAPAADQVMEQSPLGK
jgi:hypothetical protein